MGHRSIHNMCLTGASEGMDTNVGRRKRLQDRGELVLRSTKPASGPLDDTLPQPRQGAESLMVGSIRHNMERNRRKDNRRGNIMGQSHEP